MIVSGTEARYMTGKDEPVVVLDLAHDRRAHFTADDLRALLRKMDACR